MYLISGIENAYNSISASTRSFHSTWGVPLPDQPPGHSPSCISFVASSSGWHWAKTVERSYTPLTEQESCKARSQTLTRLYEHTKHTTRTCSSFQPIIVPGRHFPEGQNTKCILSFLRKEGNRFKNQDELTRYILPTLSSNAHTWLMYLFVQPLT